MKLRFRVQLVLLLTLGALVPPVALGAQGSYSAEKQLGSAAQQVPAYLAHAGVEQRLGQSLPLQTLYTDETGRTAPLLSDLNGKPTVLALVYFKCAMLCPQVLQGLATSLHQTTLTLGKDYNVLVFSIDPSDTPEAAADARRHFLAAVGAPAPDEASVHFLTSNPAGIAAIASATGFHYVLVPGPDGKMDQFAHSSVIMFATPDGHLSKYLAGVDYPARDMRMALLEASAHRISNPADLLILYCCSYDPVVGKYSVSVVRILGIAGMIACAIVIGMLFLLSRKPTGRTA